MVPVAHEFDDYAQKVKDLLSAADFDAEVDVGNEKFNKKVRPLFLTFLPTELLQLLANQKPAT